MNLFVNLKIESLKSKITPLPIFKLTLDFSLFLVTCLFIGACTNPSEKNSDEREIRMVRSESNKAIASHDTAAMAKTMTIDYHVVTSRDAESSGRLAMLQRFVSDAPDVIYVRTTENIRIYPEWKMASESGTWIGRWTKDGEKIELGGTYFAKWHKVDGMWKIRAEIFVPLHCAGGTFCEKGPI
jgi:ketosteroid isomerase-like protein